MRHVPPIMLLLFIGFIGAGTVSSQDSFIGMDELTQQLRQVEELAESLELPEDGIVNKQASQAAKKLFQQFNSPEHQAKLRQEEQRLRETLFADVPQMPQPEEDGKQTEIPQGQLADHERVYLFFSSSVPNTTLQTYMTMIELAQDPNLVMVMRGFIDGMEKIQPTMQYLQDLFNKDPNCNPLKKKCDFFRINIQINPLLFRQYGIAAAPTVVFATNVTQKGDQDEASGPAFIIEGDAALDYLLERINHKAKSKTLEALIRALQGA